MLSQIKLSDLPSFGLGMQQGMQRGEALMLLRQLELKFGKVPELLRRRVEAADADVLLQWSERILTADTIDAVFGNV